MGCLTRIALNYAGTKLGPNPTKEKALSVTEEIIKNASGIGDNTILYLDESIHIC